jgi:hypothetical protein
LCVSAARRLVEQACFRHTIQERQETVRVVETTGEQKKKPVNERFVYCETGKKTGEPLSLPLFKRLSVRDPPARSFSCQSTGS